MSAKDEYLANEADNWFLRNFKNLCAKEVSYGTELISAFISKQKFAQKLNVLEIGCCFGYNLVYLLNNFDNLNCFGFEPSQKAIDYANQKYKTHIEKSNLNFVRGTADTLPFCDNFFDFVIVGFCLYQVDRFLLQKTIAEIDRVLKHSSFLCLTDFEPIYSFKRVNEHNAATPTYKTNYANYFTGGGIL